MTIFPTIPAFVPRVARSLLRTALALFLLGLAGCGGGDAASDERKSEGNPFVRKAKEKAREKDYAGAIQLYKRALEDDATLARVHLELGILFDETKDYIRAIYHYGNYLEQGKGIDPDQRKWLEDCIRHAKYSFVADMPINTGTRKTIEELTIKVDELKAQNARLLAFAQQMQRQLGQAAPPMPDLTPAPAASPAANSRTRAAESTPAAARPTEYKVVAGDTLSKVSQKVYGNPNQWERIRDANGLTNHARLRVDQVLKIPR